MKKRKIIFVRHGESEANRDKVYGGHSQCCLTDAGKDQANLTANKLINRDIEYIISSDLLRAIQTANIIKTGINYSLQGEENKLFRELDCGEFTGRKKGSKPILYMALESKDGEHIEQIRERAISAVSYLKSIPGEGDILVVSHNSFMAMMFAILYGVEDLLSFREGWSMKNGEIKEIEI